LLELLATPAPLAARQVALQRLAEAKGARERLESDDPEALHDLRVAMRRLRSWLRAFRPVLDDTVRRKTRRRLRDVAQATNRARDAEVALEWLAALPEDAPARVRRGHRYLTERLEHDRDAAQREATRALAREFPRLLGQLEEQLSEHWKRVGLGENHEDPLMGAIAAEVMRAAAARLRRALRRVDSARSSTEAHRARVAAKRLRYLLEPFREDERAADLVGRLQKLQDVLGDHRDAHVLGARAARELVTIAGEDARDRLDETLEPSDDPDEPSAATRVRRFRAGLTDIAARARDREDERFATFEREWKDGGGADALLEDVSTLVSGYAKAR
jgi:CHAD domain-containing protein